MSSNNPFTDKIAEERRELLSELRKKRKDIHAEAALLRRVAAAVPEELYPLIRRTWPCADTVFIWPLAREEVRTLAQALIAVFGTAQKRWDGATGEFDLVWDLPDGGTVWLCEYPAPPSCKIIPEEVAIPAEPARTETRYRIDCGDRSPEEALAVAD